VIALIVLFLLLAVVAAYQIQLAGRRAELDDRPAAVPAGP
jgi:hypothetical protein